MGDPKDKSKPGDKGEGEELEDLDLESEESGEEIAERVRGGARRMIS